MKLTIDVTPWLYQRLVDEADRRDSSPEEVATWSVEMYLKSAATAEDAAVWRRFREEQAAERGYLSNEDLSRRSMYEDR